METPIDKERRPETPVGFHPKKRPLGHERKIRQLITFGTLTVCWGTVCELEHHQNHHLPWVLSTNSMCHGFQFTNCNKLPETIHESSEACCSWCEVSELIIPKSNPALEWFPILIKIESKENLDIILWWRCNMCYLKICIISYCSMRDHTTACDMLLYHITSHHII